MKKSLFKASVLSVLGAATIFGSANAADLNWHGRYRWEGVSLNNPNLTSDKKEKSYFLHHLILEPKIVAADGLNIHGRFDLMNSGYYPGSQVGQLMGRGPRSSTSPVTGTTNATDSNVLSRNQSPETLVVSELYLVWLQEFSSFMAGRMPLHFGLGITHNGGKGDFDHWLNTKDLVGYKMVFGNMSITPMYGKVNEGAPTEEDDINEYIFHLQYDNPESDTAIGVLYEVRNSGKFGNDAPTTATAGNEHFAGTLQEGWDGRQWNIYFSRGFDSWSTAFEASFLNGATGVKSALGQDINLNAFAVAGEIDYSNPESKLGWTVKLGLASGDDPATAEKYEGYLVNRNYDIANILFNHHIGAAGYDMLRTGLGGRLTDGLDDEFISNVMWFAPNLNYKMSDKWDWTTRFVYATLLNGPIANDNVDKAVGYEIDANFTYRPNARLSWTIETGIVAPGAAFKGGSNLFPTNNAFVLGTKAAVSF